MQIGVHTGWRSVLYPILAGFDAGCPRNRDYSRSYASVCLGRVNRLISAPKIAADLT